MMILALRNLPGRHTGCPMENGYICKMPQASMNCSRRSNHIFKKVILQESQSSSDSPVFPAKINTIMRNIETLDNSPTDHFKVGPFYYKVEDNTVLVSKDIPNGIENIGLYTYENNEQAAEAAWQMANMQARA